MNVRVPGKPVHIALFLLLAFLCYQARRTPRR